MRNWAKAVIGEQVDLEYLNGIEISILCEIAELKRCLELDLWGEGWICWLWQRDYDLLVVLKEKIKEKFVSITGVIMMALSRRRNKVRVGKVKGRVVVLRIGTMTE